MALAEARWSFAGGFRRRWSASSTGAVAARTPGLAGAKGVAGEVGSQLPDYLAVGGERREKE